jgi:hypothetical protein
MEFIFVKLTDKLMEKADKIADARISSNMYNRFNSNADKRKERAYIGALGEVCFEKILKDKKISYYTDIYINNSPDSGDFFCPNEEGICIDIKIAKTKKDPQESWRFGIPIDQTPWKKDLIIIGWWNPDTNKVFFYGSINGKKLLDRCTTNSNSLTGERYLTENVELKWGELDPKIPEIKGFFINN